MPNCQNVSAGKGQKAESRIRIVTELRWENVFRIHTSAEQKFKSFYEKRKVKVTN